MPQFYLKNFSPDGKSISLFNKKAVRAVTSTGIKTQCYRDYFYGKDLKLENWLGELEGLAANVLKKIISSTSIPERKDDMYEHLLLYVAVQVSRTTYAAEEMSQIRSLTSGDLNSLSGSECPHTALQYAMRMLSGFYSLSSKLIINRTKEKFITSDNPSVFYNVFTEKLNKSKGCHINSLGLKIFLPISPDLMIIFYDESIYKLGEKKSRLIELNYLSDAIELNKLQFVSCEQNVYFKDKAYNPLKLHNDVQKHYRSQKLKILKKTSESGVNATRIDVKIGLKLSFLTLKKKARLLLRSPNEIEFEKGRDKNLTNQIIHIIKQFYNGALNDSEFEQSFLDLAKLKSAQMLGKG